MLLNFIVLTTFLLFQTSQIVPFEPTFKPLSSGRFLPPSYPMADNVEPAVLKAIQEDLGDTGKVIAEVRNKKALLDNDGDACFVKIPAEHIYSVTEPNAPESVKGSWPTHL